MRVEHEVFEPMPELWEAEQLLEHKDNCTKCDKKYVLKAELKHHMALCHMKDKSSKLFLCLLDLVHFCHQLVLGEIFGSSLHIHHAVDALQK